MGNLDELKRFENDLKASEELRKKMDGITTRIREAGEAGSDGEIVVAAAKELGYDISVAALEQAKAEAETLDPAELETVSGGIRNTDEDPCFIMYEAKYVDEYGHNWNCVTVWHCNVAFLHNDSKDHDNVCWKDYQCTVINKDFGS